MKILFCGLGSIGQRHLRNIKKLKIKCEISCYKSTKKNIVLNDKNIILKNKKIKQYYEIKNVFYNIEEAIRYNPDIVFITNPSSLHIKYALKFYNSKTIIFIEKPIAINSRDLEKLYNLDIKQKRSFVFPGMQLRFHPLILKLKNVIDQKTLGDIQGAFFLNCEFLPNWHEYENYKKTYVARKDLGGGSLLTQIHELDFVTWIFGYPKKILCSGGKNSSLKIDVEDNVTSNLFYRKDKNSFCITILQNLITDPPIRKFTVVGSLGTIDCNLTDNTFNLKLKHKKPNIISLKFNQDDLYQKQLILLFKFLKNEKYQLIDIKDSRKLISLVDELKKSMRQKKIIKLN
tara:strand:+ start:1098 stop:2132 length:1035 start_codon:yes stop_codon:yes gene_type:complete